MKKNNIYLLIVFIVVASFVYFMNNQHINLETPTKAKVVVEEESDFKVVKDDVVKIIKGDEELLIDSSLFTDDEKRRIIKNVKQIVEKHDKYLYQSEQFNNDISDFDCFFNEYEYKDNGIYLKHTGDYEVGFSIKENQSINFVNFISDRRELDYQSIDILVKEIEVDPNKPMVALTFDDGPAIYNTMEIVDKLKEYDSAATFFILGYRLDDKAEILNAIIESGSEIGGHSYDHKKMIDLDENELMMQLTLVRDIVKNKTDNNYEIKLFRPPYGAIDDTLKEKSPYPLILWDHDTYDWKVKKPKKIIGNVINNLNDGSIILLHDIHQFTKEAVLELIPMIKEKGYQIVTVSQMFEAKGIELKPGEVYYSIHKIGE
jgi:peptidoglycan/xylan/chitin deacetylase (PgdA/CDA1 family)